ncbi:unnamed protein product [Echinostoma caproni]|uniref:G_PROTEIN_RECEP_F1_2 domain-containing protein n=1 Tax=Echinostoma caproni TaxID=27848 RepID=A0A183AI00_9TREM|nr:unnamed protein product [Echinostoma caproni]
MQSTNDSSSLTFQSGAYERVRDPILPVPVFGFTAVFLGTGSLLNIISWYGLYRIQLQSLVSRILLYNECIFDFLVCLTSLIALRPFHRDPRNVIIGELLCYIGRNTGLTTFTRMLMNFNIVCVSLDRFWAIVYCKTYKEKKKTYLFICYLVIFLFATLITIPTFLQVDFIDNTCVVVLDHVFVHLPMIVNVLLAYALPVTVILITSALTLRALRRQRLPGFNTSSNISDRNSLEGISSLDVIHSALSASTTGFCTIMILLALLGAVMSVLYELSLIDFRFDSIARAYFIAVCGLVSSSIPVIQIRTIPPLRRWYLNRLKAIRLACGRLLDRIQVQCCSTHDQELATSTSH